MNTELTSVFFDSLDKIKFKQGSNTYLRPEFTQMGWWIAENWLCLLLVILIGLGLDKSLASN